MAPFTMSEKGEKGERRGREERDEREERGRERAREKRETERGGESSSHLTLEQFWMILKVPGVTFMLVDKED